MRVGCSWSKVLCGLAFWNFAAGVTLASSVVTVSVEPLALIIREICAADCEVLTLVPKGASEHGWQPGPKDIVKARNAVAAVAIGLGFDDSWFKKISPAKESILWLGELLSPMGWWSDDMGGKSGGLAEHVHGNRDYSKDPHVWTDAGRMSHASLIVSQHLAKIIPTASKGLTERGQQISQRMINLQLEVDARRKAWRTRPVVMFHDVAGYFARRFNLPVLSVSAGGSGHELSAHMIADVAQRFRGASVAGIMVERNDGAAKTLARELKTKVKVVDFSAARNYPKWDDWYLEIVRSWEETLK